MRYMATGILLLFVTSAMAQWPPPSIPPMVPHPNPSSPLVIPQAPPIPVSPAPNFYPGSNLARTNQVVNPPLSVSCPSQATASPTRLVLSVAPSQSHGEAIAAYRVWDWCGRPAAA
jgi:hypothetical protein